MPLGRFVGARLHATLAFAGALAAGSAAASPVTVTLDVGFGNRYDYGRQSYQPFTASGKVVLRFENVRTSVSDYGTTTISDYMGGTRFTSPFTAQLASDPYGGGPAAAFQYTFPNVSDYSSTFIEEFAAQGNTYSQSAQAGAFYAYHIETRITRRTPTRGGSGVEDYAFTPAANVAFLQDAMEHPDLYGISFSESAYVYDERTRTYRYGFLLSDYQARIASIDTGAAAAVPEPATALLLGAGLVSLVGAKRRGRWMAG